MDGAWSTDEVEAIVGDHFEMLRKELAGVTGRYGSSPETAFDVDIRGVSGGRFSSYVSTVLQTELPDGFWNSFLPQQMDTSASRSPYFLAYQAAQVKMGDKGFLSRDITVLDLLLNRTDVHHVYPRNHLKQAGLARGRYNQIANFVLAQSEINIAIGDKAPEKYFAELANQVAKGKARYGGIVKESELRANFEMHCLPASLLEGVVPEYDEFLEARRVSMGSKLRRWLESL